MNLSCRCPKLIAATLFLAFLVATPHLCTYIKIFNAIEKVVGTGDLRKVMHMHIKKLTIPILALATLLPKTWSSFACSLPSLSREHPASTAIIHLTFSSTNVPWEKLYLRCSKNLLELMLSAKINEVSLSALNHRPEEKDRFLLFDMNRSMAWNTLCLIRTKLHLFPAVSPKGAVKGSCGWLRTVTKWDQNTALYYAWAILSECGCTAISVRTMWWAHSVVKCQKGEETMMFYEDGLERMGRMISVMSAHEV